ncbi:hypothetical protein [Hymenobacter psoromatis]|uniref:hypothetical protein n=1 Tax=Hymenobacter psoromatis TaxID=1484116 RepID=UPI001CC12A9F|nr:hypothetical protein [Hymenobacter psoromatis]
MLFLKRIVTVLALIYLLLALLILFFPFVRTSTVGIFSAYSLPMEVNMLLGFSWASVAVIGLLLLIENLDSGLLRRRVGKQEQKINELKAQLFDAQKPLAAPGAYPPPPAPMRPPGVSYPTADQERRAGPPPFPTPPPTTY